jgi:hypothetical protein
MIEFVVTFFSLSPSQMCRRNPAPIAQGGVVMSSPSNNQKSGDNAIHLAFECANGICPAGEKAGSAFMKEGRVPVLSCEGSCLRGEIARLAANIISKTDGFARACHGEALTVP